MAESDHAGFPIEPPRHPTTGDPKTWPEEIRIRYGVRAHRPWIRIVLAAAAPALGLALTWWAWQGAHPTVSAGVTTYETLADDHLRIDFTIQRRSPVAVTCILRARSADGFDVAYTSLDLPAAVGTTQHAVDLRTAGRARIGELLGCGVGSAPTGVPGAQFRPGVLPPPQPWQPAPA
jgi:hypothetical protein